MQEKRIAIKIGSNVLAAKEGGLDLDRIKQLVSQISTLHKKGFEIILISSGAVAAGRSQITDDKLDAVSARQLFSAIGQAKLINHYYDFFKEQGIICGQVLTTKESLGTRSHYLNQRNCMEVMLQHGVVPIVNENDTISVTELMFTDNDELSGMVATMMDASRLIILSNIDGIYDGNPSEPTSSVIREVFPGKRDLSAYIQTSKSSFGRGGMQTKTNIASKVADEGLEVIIANGKKDDILLKLLTSHDEVICTRFLPSEEPATSVKKWIAHSEGFAKGEIHIDAKAAEALMDEETASSVLMVGVTEIIGNFEKDDIVKIFDVNNHQLGVGKTQYASEDAKKLIGKKGKKPIVHYDYMYLF
ncbi:MAG: glutamate 5-kinase [Paludibacteraceae bacterium]|nr:glutamate 5-kinase [Paludibacteraceae bacterium]